jgi:hypothetical protein
MNLPVLAMDFLDIFRGFSTQRKEGAPLPMIHVYGFIKVERLYELYFRAKQTKTFYKPLK